MRERQDYVVQSTTDDPDLAAVCRIVFEAIIDRIEVAHIDAFSDYGDRMPDDIKTVEAWLRQLSSHQTESGDGIGVKIRPADSPGWDFLRAYTPWSIHVEVFDAATRNVATFHDCGVSIITSLSASEAADLAGALPVGYEVEPLIRR